MPAPSLDKPSKVEEMVGGEEEALKNQAAEERQSEESPPEEPRRRCRLVRASSNTQQDKEYDNDAVECDYEGDRGIESFRPCWNRPQRLYGSSNSPPPHRRRRSRLQRAREGPGQ